MDRSRVRIALNMSSESYLSPCAFLYRAATLAIWARQVIKPLLLAFGHAKLSMCDTKHTLYLRVPISVSGVVVLVLRLCHTRVGMCRGLREFAGIRAKAMSAENQFAIPLARSDSQLD
jgi:hypothetical protein